MNKIIYFLLLLPFIGFSQLSGNYRIYTANPDANFRTLASAVTRVNAVGVSAPVVFLLENTTETVSSAIVINQFTGTSTTNTLTIKPNTGFIGLTVQGAIGNGAVIQFNGADNIIIDGNNGSSNKQLTIYNTFNDSGNSYTVRAATWMYNTAANNKIQNLTLRLNIVGITNGTFSTGVYAGGTVIGNAGDNSGNTVDNVLFTDVKQAVYVNANSATNWTVSNSTLGSATDANKPYTGIYMNGVTTYTISGNTINGIKRPSGLGGSANNAAVYVNGSTGTISSNVISNVENATGNNTCYGIFVNGNTTNITGNTITGVTTNSSDNGNAAISVTGNSITIGSNKVYTVIASDQKLISGIYTSGNTQLIYNNMVSNVASQGGGDPATQGGYGIYLNSGSDVKVYYNSVRMETNQAYGASAALFVNATTQMDIRNNIFANLQTSGTCIKFTVYSNTTTASNYTNIDYNDYYFVSSATSYLGTWGSFYSANYKSTVATWAGVTGKDSHSILTAPLYTSATDLHLSAVQSALNIGTAITGITTDIDADTRSTPSTVGADEYSKCSGGTATWNGSAWSNASEPTSTIKAAINGNYNTSTNGSFVACELTVNQNYTVTIKTGNVVEVVNNVVNSGAINIESGGSLVQNDDAGTFTGNVLTISRTTAALKQFDYTYWCSPVIGEKLGALANGGNSVFYSFNTSVNDYSAETSATVMTKGKGYISRAPENLNFNPTASYTATFTGLPNTGTISVDVIKSAVGTGNLIGNPYPSAIDADSFLSNTTNASFLTGTLYFWTHNTAIAANTPNPGSGAYAYTANDYATYNLTGPTKGVAAASGGVVPSGKIASGQGFFVELKSTLSNGTKALVFNNAMRVKTASNNGQFFRSANPQQTSSDDQQSEGQIQKNRLWLSLSNTDGAYYETLLGYVTGATNDIDYGYDGTMFDGGNYITIYSILGENKLSTQGRDINFDKNEIIPIGYSSSIEGSFTIGIENLDGFFGEQDVYLLDKSNDVMTNLKEGGYTFTTATGTFDDRFELRFINTLGTDIPVLDKNDIGVIRNGNQIQIKSNKESIASVMVYDLLGRMIFGKNNIEKTDFTTDNLSVNNQVVIVKVKTSNNLEMVKKVIMN
ncbi:T9SS sorting signal type C domain-containing protein [Flavobacterium sp. 3HN19-14]|uniref:T9SS sorting signal type C domain-containing protein n=1 Tax=Flavobacterium sp. 3HN19-14 TaxID=3448133 RepID=UPI003EE307F7